MYLHKNIFLEDPPGVPIEILSLADRIARASHLLSHWAPLYFVNYARAILDLPFILDRMRETADSIQPL